MRAQRKRAWRRWCWRLLITAGLLGVLIAPFWDEIAREVILPIVKEKLARWLGKEFEPFPTPTPPLPQPQPTPGEDLWASKDLPERLKAALGEVWDQSLLPPLQAANERHDHGNFYHYVFRHQGLELAFDTRYRLFSVIFQTNHQPGYSTFMGKVLDGKLDLNLDLDRRMVQDILRTWHWFISRGDTDCYSNAGDEWCIVYDSGGDTNTGNDQVLNVVLKMGEDDSRFPGYRIGCDSRRLWPLPPPLPTLDHAGDDKTRGELSAKLIGRALMPSVPAGQD